MIKCYILKYKTRYILRYDNKNTEQINRCIYFKIINRLGAPDIEWQRIPETPEPLSSASDTDIMTDQRNQKLKDSKINVRQTEALNYARAYLSVCIYKLLICK